MAAVLLWIALPWIALPWMALPWMELMMSPRWASTSVSLSVFFGLVSKI